MQSFSSEAGESPYKPSLDPDSTLTAIEAPYYFGRINEEGKRSKGGCIRFNNFQLLFYRLPPIFLMPDKSFIGMSEELQRYGELVLINYDHLKQEAYSQLLTLWPRFSLYNNFERFIILNLVVIGIYLLLSLITSFSIRGIYSKVMKLVFDLPPIRNYILSQVEKARKDVLKQHPKELLVDIRKVPYKPPSIDLGDASEKEALKGKASGSRYAVQQHSKFITSLSKLFSYTNPLHCDTFPLVKQMETEIIAMTADFIGLKNEEGKHCGTCNSGGTESILMAMFAYREYKMRECGVIKPNMVICQTAHAAAIKACHYFDIEIRMIPFDSNYQMHLRKMKRAIDSDTICVYTSYPNYPIGTVDQIQEIGPYCQKRGVPVHVDMCLGGFVAPFADKNWKLPAGITSVSCDHHKYGLSAKGVSVLLFSSEKYRRYQYFVTTHWPGGLYGTPGVSGSRSGTFIASAWISMMKTGRRGYEENARLLQNTLQKVAQEFKKLGFQILNKQNICVICFRHKVIPLNAILTFMKKKGWNFSITAKPQAFQFSFTPLSCLKGDDMIRDMKECMEHINKNGYPEKVSTELAVYGACGQIKDDGKKNLMLAMMIDTFIDLQ